MQDADDADRASSGQQPDGDSSPDHVGEGPAAPGRAWDEPTRSRVVAGGVIAIVAGIALVATLVGGDTDLEAPSAGAPVGTETPGDGQRPTPPASATPTPTAAPTPAPTPPPTPAPTPAPAPTTAPGVVPTSAGPPTTVALDDTSVTSARIVGSVVPDVIASPTALEPIAEQAAIEALAATPRNGVAAVGPVGALCAAVRLDVAVELSGRWERNGSEVETTELTTVGPPGFGDCLGNDDGEPLDDGSYQFLVADGAGRESAAGTFVIGAERIDQRFVNNGVQRICAIRIGPASSDRYDAYVFETTPIAAGVSVTLPMADIRHDVRVTGCGETEPRPEFDVDPEVGTTRDLVP